MPVLARPFQPVPPAAGIRGRICAVQGGELIQWTTHDADGRRRQRAGDGESVRSAGRECDEIGGMPQADVAVLAARSADPTRGHRARSAGAHAPLVLRAVDFKKPAALEARRNQQSGGNLDRQSDCRYRARTAVRLAAERKQALASLTSLPLAGHAAPPLPGSPTANDHEVLNGFGRRPASCPAMLPAVTAG
jgi:hypothetical protein